MQVNDSEPCPCKSGKVFGQCHGHYLRHIDLLSPSPKRLENLSQNSRLAEALVAGERRRYGYGKPFASWEEDGIRFVAVGDRAYGNKSWGTFTDFLFFFLRETIGPEWWIGQASLPAPQQHPMIGQAALFAKVQTTSKPDRNGLYSVVPTPSMIALVGLAYDLYLCAHNETIPPLLIERLKTTDLYEGALYEAHVAGLFARAGFKITFEDESRGGKSHCEFTAQCNGTGALFSVEAKAVTTRSSRSGHSEKLPHLRGKLYEALRKTVEHPRMVFIELNRANRPGLPQWLPHIAHQLKEAEANLTIKGNPAPPAYVYVTNRPYLVHRGGFEFGSQLAASGFKIADFPPERLGGVLAMQKARLKHIEAYQVLRAAQQLSVIPSRFVRDPLALMLDAAEQERANRSNASAAFHPLDMFDWLFATYKDSSEDNLRKWLSDHYSNEHLAALNQLQLAEVYCAGLAQGMANDHWKRKGLR